MCHTRRVLEVIQYGLIAAGLMSGVVFALVFRYAARQAGVDRVDEELGLPPAEVVSRQAVSGAMDPGFRAARTTRRGVLRTIRLVQAGFIAMGITSIFFIFLCLLGMIAVFVASGVG